LPGKNTNQLGSLSMARTRRVAFGIAAAGAALMSIPGAWIGCGGDDEAAPLDAGGEASAEGGGEAGADAGTDGRDDGAPVTVSCATYCSQVTAHCLGDVFVTGGADAASKQYISRDGCMAACARMQLGTIDDTQGDTVGCRQYHSGLPAAANPVTHCPHAGIVGAAQCSAQAGRCATFCRLLVKICLADSGTGVGVGEQPFPDEPACLTACANAPYTLSLSDNELLLAGNNLNCRQYHLMAAYSNIDAGTAVLHCPHLGVVSATCK
jgi:hypothetical protein